MYRQSQKPLLSSEQQQQHLSTLMEDIRAKDRSEDLSTKEDKKREDESQDQNKLTSDGGWRWVVCLGALTVNFLTVGQQNSAGVLYSALLSEYSTQRGETGNTAA